MSPQSFHNGRVVLHAGDCLDVLDALPENSVDAVVTDPPYHLTSVVKRFGKTSLDGDGTNEQRARAGSDAAARLSRGFMGKEWDGGDIAFRPELWAKVLRVLKPGGHLLAFNGTRSYHNMGWAIEQAGFEVRDAVMWHYGSGFPKSHDISKAIDRMAGAEREVIAKGAPVKRMIPGADQNRDGWEKNNGRVFIPTESAPATDAAKQWQGWGTALKPATEIICLARKPLSEPTIAANVLRWGTGALNIDATRIETSEDQRRPSSGGDNGLCGTSTFKIRERKIEDQKITSGRWPANLVHDGSEEVLAGFPNAGGGYGSENRADGTGIYGKFSGDTQGKTVGFGDSGSAARFYYSAKADKNDRLASKHPTVKPVDLMRWLVRMITPPGGTVLDPFAGTGTTAHAALLEGFQAVLIEREAEYRSDIERRMALVFAGAGERTQAIHKQADDHGPLFAGMAE